MLKDYYRILGLGRGASQAEIKRAYRTLAMAYHPDSNPDPVAHDRFVEVNEAYQILSDTQKKWEYDQRYELFKQGKLHQKSRASTPHTRGPFKDPGAQPETPEEKAERARRYRAAKTYEARKRKEEFDRYRKAGIIGCIVALAFFLSLGLDLMFASRSPVEVIQKVEISPLSWDQQTVRIQTASTRIQFSDQPQRIALISPGGFMALGNTPIYRITHRLYYWQPRDLPGDPVLSEEEWESQKPDTKFFPKAGIYNVFSFLPILMFISASLGLWFRNQSESLFKFAMGAIFLLPICLIMLVVS